MADYLEGGQPQAAPHLAVSGPKSSDRNEEESVSAAGGVLRRRVRRGWRRHDEVVVVHRPRYDDWSFPKGKRDPGESDVQTARREVFEETGLVCRLGREIGATRYEDSRSRQKVVRYWLMEPERGQSDQGFVPNREVDELRWCSIDEASKLLTYEHDRELLEQLRETRPRQRPRQQPRHRKGSLSGGVLASPRESGKSKRVGRA